MEDHGLAVKAMMPVEVVSSCKYSLLPKSISFALRRWSLLVMLYAAVYQSNSGS